LLRRRSSAERHFVWLAALATTLGVALLTPVAPRIAIPVPRTETVAGVGMAAPLSSTARGGLVPGPRLALPSRAHTSPAVPSDATLVALWLAGCASVLLWSAVGHLGLWRLSRRMRPIDTTFPAKLPTRRDVRLGTSASVSAPVTWGWRRPV